MRWVNYHLAREGQELRITNLGADLKDSLAYTHLLHSLDRACGLEALSEPDLLKRAEHVVRHSIDTIGAPDLLAPKDIAEGNAKLNTVFLAELFNTKHGLEELNEEERAQVESATNDYDDIEGSRDESLQTVDQLTQHRRHPRLRSLRRGQRRPPHAQSHPQD